MALHVAYLCLFVYGERNRTVGRAVTVHTPHLILSASQYICLFNDAVCLSNYTTSKRRLLMNPDLEKAMFKVMVT